MRDGTPLDIVLNPIGVPIPNEPRTACLRPTSAWAAHQLGFSAITPVFDSASEDEIEDELARAWFVNASGAREHRDIASSSINRDVVRLWLADRGYDYDELHSDDAELAGKASEACMRIWLREVADKDVSNLSNEELLEEAAPYRP